MNDRDSLIKACLDHPDEDVPRLMLADWFSENEGPVRSHSLKDNEEAFWQVTCFDHEWVLRWGTKTNITLIVNWSNLTYGDTPVCSICLQDRPTVDLVPNPVMAIFDNNYERRWSCVECRERLVRGEFRVETGGWVG